MKGKVIDHLGDGRPVIQIDCGCQYVDARAPVVPCKDHMYITCGQCKGKAEVTPFGVICLTCTKL